MKTFNKTYLPDEIIYNGNTYKPNSSIEAGSMLSGTPLKTIAHTLKQEGRKMLVVNVLSKNLKGKTDLYGQPYKPTRHILTT